MASVGARVRLILNAKRVRSQQLSQEHLPSTPVLRCGRAPLVPAAARRARRASHAPLPGRRMSKRSNKIAPGHAPEWLGGRFEINGRTSYRAVRYTDGARRRRRRHRGSDFGASGGCAMLSDGACAGGVRGGGGGEGRWSPLWWGTFEKR
jgi:hypothetical protein